MKMLSEIGSFFFSLKQKKAAKKQQKNINRLASLMATKNKNKCMQSVLEHYWESDNWLARISVAYIYKHNWKDNWWQWNECQHITIFHHRNVFELKTLKSLCSNQILAFRWNVSKNIQRISLNSNQRSIVLIGWKTNFWKSTNICSSLNFSKCFNF